MVYIDQILVTMYKWRIRMVKFEGVITLQVRNGHTMITGFTRNDFKLLLKMARKKYKIKSTKKRILKKYANRLLKAAILNYVAELPVASEAP
jgi:hypothetical protein